MHLNLLDIRSRIWRCFLSSNYIILENKIVFSSIVSNLQETIVNVPLPVALMLKKLLSLEIHTTFYNCLSHQITYLLEK